MTEILLDAVIDTLKLVPFLFVTYWFMEWLEHKTGTKTQALILSLIHIWMRQEEW